MSINRVHITLNKRTGLHVDIFKCNFEGITNCCLVYQSACKTTLQFTVILCFNVSNYTGNSLTVMKDRGPYSETWYKAIPAVLLGSVRPQFFDL